MTIPDDDRSVLAFGRDEGERRWEQRTERQTVSDTVQAGVWGPPTLVDGGATTTRACAGLSEAWLYATSPQMFRGSDAEAFERLQAGCRAVVFGADCYAYGLLANGTVDLVCEASMQPYDYCALVPVVQGAGGVISDWSGAPLGLDSDGRVLAAGDSRIHAAALAALAG